MKKILSFQMVILFTIFCFLFFNQVHGQTPQKFSYQSVIRNASNQIVTNQQIGVKISIIQGSESGILVYSEKHTPTTNANGLISIIVGNGTIVSGDIASINWSNGPFFLKSETDPTGGTNYIVTITNQILSVPYALYAEESGTPGPQGPQGEPGPQGPQGDPGPQGTSDVQGSISYIPKFLSSNSIGNSRILELGNGISVRSPNGSYPQLDYLTYNDTEASLYLFGNSTKFVLEKVSTDDINVIQFSKSQSYKWSLGTFGNDNFSLFNHETGYNAISVSSNSSNIGLGTNTPLQKLDVNGNIFCSGPLGYLISNNVGPMITKGYDLFSEGNYQGAGRWGIFIEPSALVCGIPNIENSNFDISTYNESSTIANNLFHIGSNGNAGIGTNSPSAKLEIQNASSDATPQLKLFENSAGYARLQFQNSSSSSFWTIAAINNLSNSEEKFNFYNSTSGDIMTLKGDGNVGVGTSSPLQKLHVNGNIYLSGVQGIMLDNKLGAMINKGYDMFTSGLYSGAGRWGMFIEPSALTMGIPNLTERKFQFVTYNENSSIASTLVTIKQNGNVGIGNSNPSEKIDIEGNVKMSGALMPNNNPGVAGKFLSSSGANNPPTWESPTSFIYNNMYEINSSEATPNINDGQASVIPGCNYSFDTSIPVKVLVYNTANLYTNDEEALCYFQLRISGSLTWTGGTTEYIKQYSPENAQYNKLLYLSPGSYNFQLWISREFSSSGGYVRANSGSMIFLVIPQ